MVGCSIQLMKSETEWLNTLLQSKFFGSCRDHRDLRKNEKNMFCIDCNLGFCKHCITSSAHCLHRLLQICKYVYHDVVRLQDIQKYLDCSNIQTYKINGEKAIHLNSRPQSRDTKSSASKSKIGLCCEACGRHIQDFPNRFCSIACKVGILAEKSNENNNHKKLYLQVPDYNTLSLKENYDRTVNIWGNEEFSPSKNESCLSRSESSEEMMSSRLRLKKQSHKRKGVPRRAPLN